MKQNRKLKEVKRKGRKRSPRWGDGRLLSTGKESSGGEKERGSGGGRWTAPNVPRLSLEDFLTFITPLPTASKLGSPVTRK